MKLTDKKAVHALTFLCAAVYFVSYITRKNFSAVISEYVVAENVAKASASLVTVAMFVCYGVGQLISGWLGDRFAPKTIILGGLSATILFNILVPVFGSNTFILMIIWGLNGLAQAMIWPPMVKILSDFLNPVDYQNACVKVSLGGNIGTIGIYLIASGAVKFLGSWRSVFVFSAVCGFIMVIIWQFSIGKIESKRSGEESAKVEENAAVPEKTGVNLFAATPLLLIMIVIICQGMLRDGVETWMPSYLHDVFALDTSSSILTSVGLPIFSVLSIQAVSVIYRKFFKNEMACAAVIFGATLLFALLLGIFSDVNVWLSVLLTVLLTGTMHGVNLILTCYVAARYAKYGNVSFISGLLNSCTYVGSAAFTYGVAKLADIFDWSTTIFCWAAVAAVGLICASLSIHRWNKV